MRWQFIALLFLSFMYSLAFAQALAPEDHVWNPASVPALEGEMISLATRSAQAFGVYESKSKVNRGEGAGILLIHEWWGLTDAVKSTADQLSRLGYDVVAVDLYQGRVTQEAEVGAKWMKEMQPAETLAKLEAALDYLSLSQKKIAVIGWCFGGGWALKLSLARPEQVSATVIYYGELQTNPEKLRKLRGPVLGIFATQDEWITPAWVQAFETALDQAGVPHEIYSYDAGHAFANPSNQHFSPEAYQDAWSKTLEFLQKYVIV